MPAYYPDDPPEYYAPPPQPVYYASGTDLLRAEARTRRAPCRARVGRRERRLCRRSTSTFG